MANYIKITFLFKDYDLNIFLTTSTLGNSDVTCSLPATNKL